MGLLCRKDGRFGTYGRDRKPSRWKSWLETAEAFGGGPATAIDGARLAKAVAVPKDKESFRKSANTADPLSFENGADSRSTIRVLGPSRLTRVLGAKV